MGGAVERVRALDGVRGLAAVAVVLGHARLVLLDHPVLGVPGMSLLSEELGILGSKAVWLFFVLSGFVLTGLMSGPARTDYGRYLASRLVRLYLPVAAAVALTVLSVIAVPRDSGGFGGWIDAHPTALSGGGLVADLTLVGGTSGMLSPLWSLQWELLFSLLLIVYVMIAERVPWWLGVLGGVALSAVGAAVGSSVLLYLPMFAIGVSLALGWPALEAWAARLRARVRTGAPALPGVGSRLPDGRGTFAVAVAGIAEAGIAVVGVALVLTLVSLVALVPPEARDQPGPRLLDTVASLVAAVLLIVLAALSPPLARFFSSRPLRWLGLVSFSLYLVHEPVLIAVVRLAGRTPTAVATALLLAVVVAALFSRTIEQPAHRLSRRLRPGVTL